MERLTVNKNVQEMSMVELVHNSCYAKDGNAIYRDFEEEVDARELTRKLFKQYAGGDDAFTCDEDFDDYILDCLAYGTDTIEGVIALFYRNLLAQEDLYEKLKHYEDLEEQGLLRKFPCKEGDIVYRICPKCNDKHNESCENCAWRGSLSDCGCTTYGLWSDGQFPPDECTVVPYKVTWNYIPNLLKHFGKTVFLTQRDAKEALKKMNETESNQPGEKL